MLIYEGTLLAVKTLEPSGSFTKPTHLVTVLDEDGEPLRLAADDEAYTKLAELPQLAPVRLRLRLRTTRTEQGRAFKLTVSGLIAAGEPKR